MSGKTFFVIRGEPHGEDWVENVVYSSRMDAEERAVYLRRVTWPLEYEVEAWPLGNDGLGPSQ